MGARSRRLRVPHRTNDWGRGSPTLSHPFRVEIRLLKTSYNSSLNLFPEIGLSSRITRKTTRTVGAPGIWSTPDSCPRIAHPFPQCLTSPLPTCSRWDHPRNTPGSLSDLARWWSPCWVPACEHWWFRRPSASRNSGKDAEVDIIQEDSTSAPLVESS